MSILGPVYVLLGDGRLCTSAKRENNIDCLEDRARGAVLLQHQNWSSGSCDCLDLYQASLFIFISPSFAQFLAEWMFIG